MTWQMVAEMRTAAGGLRREAALVTGIADAFKRMVDAMVFEASAAARLRSDTDANWRSMVQTANELDGGARALSRRADEVERELQLAERRISEGGP